MWTIYLSEFIKGVALGMFYNFLMKLNKWTRIVFYVLVLVAIGGVILSPTDVLSITQPSISAFVAFLVGLLVGNPLGAEIADKLREDWT